MSDIVKNATDGVIDIADKALTVAIQAVATAGEAAETLISAPIRVGGAAIDVLTKEAKIQKDNLFKTLRALADAVTEPLP